MILIMKPYHNFKNLSTFPGYVCSYFFGTDGLCILQNIQNKMSKGDKDKMNTIFNALPNIMVLANISRGNFHLG